MKQFVTKILLLTFLYSFCTIYAHAVTGTPAPSTKATSTNAIDDLKDRLATKVAQLRHTEPRAIFGTVKSISEASISVETETKDMKIELTDDIKIIQIIKDKKTNLSTDDIDKGDTVAVIGNYDSTLDVLKANMIVIQNQIPTRISGIIDTTDTKEFTIRVKTADEQTYIVDYETTTKAFDWSPGTTTQPAKAGFSKINAGDFVSILGYPVPKKENRLSSTRILVINMNPEPTKQISPTPTTKKTVLAPSAKITPKSTLKPTVLVTPTPTP